MPKIFFKDQSDLQVDEGTIAIELAKKMGLTDPKDAVALFVNGTAKDLSTSLKEGDLVEFFSFDSPIGKEVFWHSSAHVLAQAVLRLFPDALPTIGPPIQDGFYYDFANLKISDENLVDIEKEMKKIVKENYKSQRVVLKNKQEALKEFGSNIFKKEIIEQLPDDAPLTAYKQGEFYDLCRGPHLYSLGKIKAMKLTKLSGAYWRADKDNEMLTRIYGISFPSKDLLQQYVTRIEEAKKRDHKILGPKLGLFSLKEYAPGMPFIHPHGMIIWNNLMSFWRELHQKAHYKEIQTPTMMSKELWEISGHWDHYREHMYTTQIEEREFAIKPMNCPGCMLYYKSALHSYREFPLRIAEVGHVHRYEYSGALSGLMRVRSFHQDDAHIFMTKDQIKSEILQLLHLTKTIYDTFDLKASFALSTKPEKNTIGSDEDWILATKALQEALDDWGQEYEMNEGDGAFYGPKIDISILDCLGRSWQCGTLQLDFALPEKFDLEYVDSQNGRQRPIMLHRAIFGSVERFFGILIEHFAGKFPLWLSPRQIRIITVADRHIPYATEMKHQLEKNGFLVDLDDAHETISKKIRLAQLEQVNYTITIGDKEVENKSLAIRLRSGRVIAGEKMETFNQKIKQEYDQKALLSIYEKEKNEE